jgi:RNA polymerase sigma-B factor
LHDLYRDILATRDRLSAVLERSPTPAELAAELDVSQEQILRALECGTAYGAASLDAPEVAGTTGDEAGRTLGDTLGAHDQDLDVVEQRQAVRDILNALPERERRILVLRYFGERTQAQIADELGISQMHVSRLLSSTIDRIRTAIASDTPQPLTWPTPRNRAA